MFNFALYAADIARCHRIEVTAGW